MFSLSDSIQISSFNTPLDVRTRVADLSKLTDGSIQMPYVGLIVWVTNEEKAYVVTGITGTQITSYKPIGDDVAITFAYTVGTTKSSELSEAIGANKIITIGDYVASVEMVGTGSSAYYVVSYTDKDGVFHQITHTSQADSTGSETTKEFVELEHPNVIPQGAKEIGGIGERNGHTFIDLIGSNSSDLGGYINNLSVEVSNDEFIFKKSDGTALFKITKGTSGDNTYLNFIELTSGNDDEVSAAIPILGFNSQNQMLQYNNGSGWVNIMKLSNLQIKDVTEDDLDTYMTGQAYTLDSSTNTYEITGQTSTEPLYAKGDLILASNGDSNNPGFILYVCSLSEESPSATPNMSDYSLQFVDLGSINDVSLVADQVKFDNSQSGLSAETVQGAIEEVNEKVLEINEKIDGEGGTYEFNYANEPCLSQIRDNYINPTTNKWTKGNKHVILDVRRFRGWNITTRTVAGNYFAWLTSDENPVTIGDTPAYVEDTQLINTDELENVIIPDGASYLYLYIASGTTKPIITIEKERTPGIEDRVESLEESALQRSDLFENVIGKNLIDESTVIFNRRINKNTMKLQNDTGLHVAITQLIEVEEGKTYALSGAFFDNTITDGGYGGYLKDGATTDNNQSIYKSIDFTNASVVSPDLTYTHIFTVPTGEDIKYVVITLRTNTDNDELSGHVQLEEGDAGTSYEAYNEKEVIKESLLPDMGGGDSEDEGGDDDGINDDALARYTDITTLSYQGISNKFPRFRKHWILKDKDLVVVNTGTSLTARTIEKCTERDDAAYRPPLLHSNNIASMIWDRIKWEGQEYRRYDAKTVQGGDTNMFTENGTFATSYNLSEWDDGGYRNGLTRYASGSCSVQFTIPSNAFQFNFIYRTDSVGSENCVIVVSGGNGLVELWNGVSWIEANGATFSMRESAVSNIGTIEMKNPYTGGNVTTAQSIQTKGNTTYQKRLKMRTTSRGTSKVVTISSASDRFMYWGVEWSSREYMISYINAARGEHSSKIPYSSSDFSDSKYLVYYQDNEVWSFNPDLICAEDPIHNYGGVKLNSNYHTTRFFANASENFFFADNDVSIKARCETLGKQLPEFIIHNSSVCKEFLKDGGVSLLVNGNLPVVFISDGNGGTIGWTALDANSSIYEYMQKAHPDVVYINAFRNWIEACNSCYGNLENATTASGAAGKTLSSEGSHYNDMGCKVMARVILPVFDFVADQTIVDNSGNERPLSAAIGTCFFDTNLTPNRPIWWNGTNWVDATGTTV